MQSKLGQKLKNERERLKLTQKEFAKFLNLTSSTYERIENDRNHDIRLECMIKILKKIDIPLDLFIPVEILNKYCIYVEPKKENNVKQFLSKEFSKIVKKVEVKFSKPSKSKIYG